VLRLMTTELNLLRMELGNGYCFVTSHLISPLYWTHPAPSMTFVVVSDTDPSFRRRLTLKVPLRDSDRGTSMTAFDLPSHCSRSSFGSSSAATGTTANRSKVSVCKNLVISP